ncbi:MAG: hypothetical protein HY078_04845 [Elusimicrobia bacterium]|nr:hypothetical protein [Elusimicrobiota bacterium]
MKDGRWLTPRYTDRAVFEKDYPTPDFNPLDVYCPGCRGVVSLSRKSPAGRPAGWCKSCLRPVTS